jgi:hypothetical protein
MSTNLNALDLDEMLLRLRDADSDDSWARLLADPNGARTWAEATERRARLDHLAARLHAHPWLAAPLWRLRVAARRVQRDSAALFEVSFTSSPLLAKLGKSDEPVVVDLSRGEPAAVSVAPGLVVRFHVSAGTVVHYLTASAFGVLESGQWQMVSGESPVLIAAVEMAGAKSEVADGARLLAAIASGSVVGAVILEEAVEQEISD